MTSHTIPHLTSIESIYPPASIPTQALRWDALVSTFTATFGRPPTYVARSPGRVNLIGEHIDYSLYAVVPMAVEQDVLLAVSLSASQSSTPRVRLRNANGARFPPADFTVRDGGVEIDARTHDWANYFKAGLRAAVQLLRSMGEQGLRRDMDVLATGTVPAGGGMSSSAAFVCASALAVARAVDVKGVGKKALVETAVVAERSVGVNSGGMDQSASVFGEIGGALHVRFVPELVVDAVEFPRLDEKLTFVVAQSLVAADKHVTAPVCYNLRVVECSLAALVLARITGLTELRRDTSPLGVSLRTFHDTFFSEKAWVFEQAGRSVADEASQLTELVQLVKNYLPQEEGYTRDEISDILGTPVDELERQYMTKFPVRADRFKLRQRALHVFTEALRVHRFLQLLRGPYADSASLVEDMGALLNETQESCRDVFECSCPELNELCSIARAAGSAGSRLTGAGWGGCSVHLVPAGRVEQVKAAWTERYYRRRFPDISEQQLAEAIVVSEPGMGSCVLEMEG